MSTFTQYTKTDGTPAWEFEATMNFRVSQDLIASIISDHPNNLIDAIIEVRETVHVQAHLGLREAKDLVYDVSQRLAEREKARREAEERANEFTQLCSACLHTVLQTYGMDEGRSVTITDTVECQACFLGNPRESVALD